MSIHPRQNGLQEDQVRGEIEKDIPKTDFDQWGISDELREEILMRVAPFHFEKQPSYGMPNRRLHIQAFSKGSKPYHRLPRFWMFYGQLLNRLRLRRSESTMLPMLLLRRRDFGLLRPSDAVTMNTSRSFRSANQSRMDHR